MSDLTEREEEIHDYFLYELQEAVPALNVDRAPVAQGFAESFAKTFVHFQGSDEQAIQDAVERGVKRSQRRERKNNE